MCLEAGPALLITPEGKGASLGRGVPQERLQSTGAEQLNSCVCVRLEAEPRACQAQCWRSPNCWKLKATLEEDTLQGSQAGEGRGAGIYCCSEPIKRGLLLLPSRGLNSAAGGEEELHLGGAGGRVTLLSSPS